jgi:hypothetical protein
MLFKELNGKQDEVVEIESVVFLQLFLVPQVNPGKFFIKSVAVLFIRNIQKLLRADKGSLERIYF